MPLATISVRAQRRRAALDLRTVVAAAAVAAAAAMLAISVAPRFAAVAGGGVLLVAGFAVMAPCQLQMAMTISALLSRRHHEAVASRTSEFVLGYLAFYAPIAILLGVIAHLLGSLAWIAIIAGAAGSLVLGLAALGLGRPRWLARCRGPLWLLASGRASFQRPLRAGVAYARYCASCCGPYVYALVVLAGGTRSVWLGAGLTAGYALSMVAPLLLVSAIAPATALRLAEGTAGLSQRLEQLTGLMLVGLGIVLVPAALVGAAS